MYWIRIIEPGQNITKMRLPSFDIDDATCLATDYFYAHQGIQQLDVLDGDDLVLSLSKR